MGQPRVENREPRLPAVALLEIDGIAAGLRTADLMVKQAPIALLKAGTVQPGHYLVLAGGTVASVEAAWRTGCAAAGAQLFDEVLLPDVHPQVHDAVLGQGRGAEQEALGVLECRRSASLLRAADAGVKGAAVVICEIRLADGLDGRAFVLFSGKVADVEAALEIGAGRTADGQLYRTSIMPRLDATLRTALDAGTRFGPAPPLEPDGAEPAVGN